MPRRKPGDPGRIPGRPPKRPPDRWPHGPVGSDHLPVVTELVIRRRLSAVLAGGFGSSR